VACWRLQAKRRLGRTAGNLGWARAMKALCMRAVAQRVLVESIMEV
jgi:hypothetical protein